MYNTLYKHQSKLINNMQGAALMQLDCEGSQQYCIEHIVRYFLSRHRSAETLCWLWYVVVVVVVGGGGLISIFMRSNAHALELT